jgi:hypothetical protein
LARVAHPGDSRDVQDVPFVAGDKVLHGSPRGSWAPRRGLHALARVDKGDQLNLILRSGAAGAGLG